MRVSITSGVVTQAHKYEQKHTEKKTKLTKNRDVTYSRDLDGLARLQQSAQFPVLLTIATVE